MRFVAMIGILLMTALPLSAAELVMVEQDGCIWCGRWDREVAGIYPKTEEGQAAPLRRVDKHAIPADLNLRARVIFTPTFVLVENGNELARIEGYPGQDFFWGLLGVMLREHTSFTDAS